MNYPNQRHTDPLGRRGLSQVEVVISALLIGVVLVGAMKVVGGSLKTRQTAVAQLDGPMLADELLAEIMAKPYEDPELPGGAVGLDSGESAPRVNFDDVDDFHNWDQTPPQDKDAVAMTDYTGWRREVDVWQAERTGGTATGSETGLKLIRVRVTSPDSDVYDRFAYLQKDGALEQKPAVDTTVVTRIEAALQLGSGDAAQAAINLVNHPADVP